MLVGLVKFAKVDMGEGGVKNPENKPSSFMDSPMSTELMVITEGFQPSQNSIERLRIYIDILKFF